MYYLRPASLVGPCRVILPTYLPTLRCDSDHQVASMLVDGTSIAQASPHKRRHRRAPLNLSDTTCKTFYQSESWTTLDFSSKVSQSANFLSVLVFICII